MTNLQLQNCETCGIAYTPQKPTSRFCSPPCFQEWWRTAVQRGMSARGVEALAKLRGEGRDPAHTGYATQSRSVSISESNRRSPRRRRELNVVPNPHKEG